MKRVLCIWFLLACAVGQVCSQTNKNLTRIVEGTGGHNCYLYRDEFMPYTVMVVDSVAYELFDVYHENNNESDLEFKFSYNGKHWMAVGKECFWVDGELKSFQGDKTKNPNEKFKISIFYITNSGHYAYKAYDENHYTKGEVVVYDGTVIIQHAIVRYFNLDAQGELIFKFDIGNRHMLYEKEKITEVPREEVPSE